MRKLFPFLLLLVCCTFAFCGILQAQNTGSTGPASTPPLSIGTVVSALLIVYEAVIRLVPTVKNNSLVHSIIVVLSSISDFLNVKKKT
jgi:hypothetical protein